MVIGYGNSKLEAHPLHCTNVNTQYVFHHVMSYSGLVHNWADLSKVLCLADMRISEERPRSPTCWAGSRSPTAPPASWTTTGSASPATRAMDPSAPGYVLELQHAQLTDPASVLASLTLLASWLLQEPRSRHFSSQSSSVICLQCRTQHAAFMMMGSPTAAATSSPAGSALCGARCAMRPRSSLAYSMVAQPAKTFLNIIV